MVQEETRVTAAAAAAPTLASVAVVVAAPSIMLRSAVRVRFKRLNGSPVGAGSYKM